MIARNYRLEIHFMNLLFSHLRRSLIIGSFSFSLVFSSFSQTPAPENTPAATSTPKTTAPATEAPLSAAAARSEAAQKELGKRFSSGWGKKLEEGGTTAIVQLLVSAFGAVFVFERF